MYKKRWYDGLNDIYEGKDEFEIKFGCFGGDGGGGSSSAQDPNDRQNAPSKSKADDMPTTGFRGEQSAAAASNQGYAGSTGTPSGNQTAGMSTEQAQANQNISDNIAAAIAANKSISNPHSLSHDMFDAPPSAPVSQNVSAVSNAPSVTGLSGFNRGFSNYSAPDVNTPSAVSLSAPTTAQDVVAQARDITSGIPGISIGPGYLTGDINPAEKSVSIGYGISYAKGGVVRQGIGSVFPYARRR